jgi:cytochrome c556
MKPMLVEDSVALTFAAVAVAADEPLDVRASMQNGVNPAMTSIWDVSNNAVSDDGGIDPSLMDDAKWAQIAEGADRLSASARPLAAGSAFLASAPDNVSIAEGEVEMVEIQKHLDADPQGFAQMAAGLADHAAKLAAAARAKDAAAAGRLVSELDGVCEGCHSVYWYPE